MQPGQRHLRAFRWGVAALIGAIVADLAEDIIDPASSSSAAKIFDATAQHHGRMIASAILLLATSAFVVPAVFSLVLKLDDRGRRIGRVAAGLALLGAMGHAALAALYLVWAEIPGGDSSRAQLVATIDRITDSPSLAIVVPLLIAFPLSLVATFIALIRAGIAPRWVLVPVAAAPVVAIVGPGSDSVSTGAALVLLLVAALGLASRVLQKPNRRSLVGAFAAVTGALALVLTTSVGAQAATTPRSAAGTALTRAGANLQQQLDALVTAGAPGVIALVHEGDQTVRLTSGYANLKKKTPIRASDRFRVGSATKTFVATVVLQLVGEEKLALTDTVERWLPGLVPNGKKITVRQLLNMTSGLFDYLNDGDTTVIDRLVSGDVDYRWTPRELVEMSKSHKPHFAPGSGWSYCNTCYVLLGMIVERATGNQLEAELEARIFEPLRLRATTLDARPRIAGRYAHGYALVDKPTLADVSVLSPSFGWAAGAIVSTADDLDRFYRALLGGRLLGPELLRTMEVTVAGNGGIRYGLGLMALQLPCGVVWGHNGGIPGYTTYALGSKDGKREIVLLTNLDEDSFSKRANDALVAALVAGYCG